MSSSSRNLDSKLWVITSYYNPAAYRTRKLHYKRFREQLKLPLATVEMAFDGRKDLTASDADILLSLDQGDVLWQKERLLNLAMKVLPDHCEAVAWLDCDILFDSLDWAKKTMEALEKYKLVHAFNGFYDIPRGEEEDWQAVAMKSEPTPSAIQSWVDGDIDAESMMAAKMSSMKGRTRRTKSGRPIGTGGIGWAARREFIQSNPLYDACVIGGGDGVLTHAIFDMAEHQAKIKFMSENFSAHYLDWARSFGAALKGEFGVVPCDVFHLWHGELVNRNYYQRHEGLSQFDFDPTTDIELADDGSWKWSSEKPEMHQYVRNFFLSRREDG